MTAYMLILSAFLLVGLSIFLIEFHAAFLWFRGSKEVVCPADGATAFIQLNAQSSAVSAALRRRPSLRLQTCSRWPELSNCNRECLHGLVAGLSQTPPVAR